MAKTVTRVREEIRNAVEAVVKRFGTLDSVIANAVLQFYAPFITQDNRAAYMIIRG